MIWVTVKSLNFDSAFLDLSIVLCECSFRQQEAQRPFGAESPDLLQHVSSLARVYDQFRIVCDDVLKRSRTPIAHIRLTSKR